MSLNKKYETSEVLLQRLQEKVSGYSRQRSRVTRELAEARNALHLINEEYRAVVTDGKDDREALLFAEMMDAKNKVREAELKLSAFHKSDAEYIAELRETEGEHRDVARALDEAASLEMEREVIEPVIALQREFEVAKERLKDISAEVGRLAQQGTELSSRIRFARNWLPREEALSYAPRAEGYPPPGTFKVKLDAQHWIQMEKPGVYGIRPHPVLDPGKSQHVTKEPEVVESLFC